jgi:dihydrofolate synthase/folylpolyglutamate synthase
MMKYEEAIDFLFNRTANFELQGVAGYKEGLGNSLALDEHYGHPHEHFRCIHIAGTNGKGSVSHSIAALLQVFGYRVGLYTSPHLLDFSERIRVNGQPVPHDYVADFVDKGKDFFESVNASFFEITTAMAFKYFKDVNIDIAVIEVGLGGRLDSTNIISPVLSIITNISLDHTQLLGTSIEQIAMEKGGIIKPGVPVVIGEATPETRMVFDALAQEAKAPIVYAEDEQEIVSSTVAPEGRIYKAKHLGEFKGELQGDYQEKNMNTVVVAMHQLVNLGYMCDCIDPDNNRKIQLEMCEALQNVSTITGLMGRWQVVRRSPLVVCDTGHNIGAWKYLSKQIESVKCKHLRIVFGMVGDKDVYGVMALLPKNATYYYTKGSTKRAFPEMSLKVFGDQFGLQGECYSGVKEAYQAAISGASSDDFIFVGGSNYIVSDFLKSRA